MKITVTVETDGMSVTDTRELGIGPLDGGDEVIITDNGGDTIIPALKGQKVAQDHLFINFEEGKDRVLGVSKPGCMHVWHGQSKVELVELFVDGVDKTPSSPTLLESFEIKAQGLHIRGDWQEGTPSKVFVLQVSRQMRPRSMRPGYEMDVNSRIDRLTYTPLGGTAQPFNPRTARGTYLKIR